VWNEPLPLLFLASCKQLRVLSLRNFNLMGPDSLVASSMLQHLVLNGCRTAAAAAAADFEDYDDDADGAAEPVSWQQVLPGPGQLPYLTSLQLAYVRPPLQHSDIECMVAAFGSGLQVLHIDSLEDTFAPALARLPAVTILHLNSVTDAVCRALAQLTGLKELRVECFSRISTNGVRQLAALQQLTSLGFHRGLGWVGREDCPVLREVMLDKLPGCSRAIVNKVRMDVRRDCGRCIDCCGCCLHVALLAVCGCGILP